MSASSHPSFAPVFAPLFDIAVVGTGLVGLASALGLAQQGWRVALLGHAPAAVPTSTPKTENDTDWDNRIYAFSPATQALLTRLNVWAQLPSDRLQAVQEMRIFPESVGNATQPLHFTAYEACVPELAWIAENRSVAQALATGCRYHPNIQWFDQQAVGWTHTATGITLDLSQGQAPPTSISARLVVGADGKHSWVRAQAGITIKTHDYQQTGVVANFTCQQPHGGTAWQWFREDGILALLPLPNKKVSMVWSANPEQTEYLLSLSPDALAQAVTQASGGVLGDLHTLTPAAGFPLGLQDASSLIAERVALVGDAAHVVHPLAGQGMNLGMGDVAALLDVIAERESYRELDDMRLLQRYSRQRALPIAAMRGVTHGLQQLFHTQHPAAQWLRKTGMQALNLPPLNVLKKKLMQHAIHH